jgi:hypothetical protein
MAVTVSAPRLVARYATMVSGCPGSLVMYGSRKMFELGVQEKIIASFKPVVQSLTSETNPRCGQDQCGRIAFRVIIVESGTERRSMPLCGLHFVDAAKSYPELASGFIEWGVWSSAAENGMEVTAFRRRDSTEVATAGSSAGLQTEEVKCKYCEASYWVSMQISKPTSPVNVLQTGAMTAVLAELVRRVTAEHNAGHCSERISISGSSDEAAPLIAIARAI